MENMTKSEEHSVNHNSVILKRKILNLLAIKNTDVRRKGSYNIATSKDYRLMEVWSTIFILGGSIPKNNFGVIASVMRPSIKKYQESFDCWCLEWVEGGPGKLKLLEVGLIDLQ